LEARENKSDIYDELKKLFYMRYGEKLENLKITPWSRHVHPILYIDEDEHEITLFLTSDTQEDTTVGYYKPVKTYFSPKKGKENYEITYRVSDLDNFKKHLEKIVWNSFEKEFDIDLDKKLQD